MPETPPTSLVPVSLDNEPTKLVRIHPLRQSFLILKNILLILIGSYGLSLTLHILLRLILGERSSTLVAFFNTFAHIMWMPTLILLPLILLFRQWRIALTFVLPVLMFLVTYGMVFLPSEAVIPPEDATVLRLQTHNLLARNRTPERIPELIQEISADIVVLQEVSSDFGDRLSELDDYPYKAIHGTVNDEALQTRDTMGLAILSRYPIIEDDYWTYDFLTLPLGHQRVVLEIDGELIVLYNTHPTHPGMTGHAFFDPSQRRMEINDLLQRIEAETLPIIWIGDFNLTDLSLEYRWITTRFTDTFREVGHGMGFTFPDLQEASVLDSVQILPDNFPDHLPTPLFLRLDYAFHSEEFMGVSAYIHHTSGGSDHRPLVVELALK